MDGRLAIKAVAVQIALVAVLAIILAVSLPHSFFEKWGWFSGPLAWMLCAAGTARILRLPLWLTLLGAALAGIPSLIAVVIGVHWLGALIGAIIFGFWCGRPVADGKASWTSA